MATPFIIGLAVAGAAYAGRGALRFASKIKANPRSMFNFEMESKTAKTAFGEGFSTKMDRPEAAAILGLTTEFDWHSEGFSTFFNFLVFHFCGEVLLSLRNDEACSGR
eukprot:gene15316-18145_t